MEYASKAVGTAGLTTGIIGTSLGAIGTGILGIQNTEGYIAAVEVVEKVDNYETEAIAAGAHDWSQEAIVWALKNNILKGDDSGLRLSDGLTREEFTVMLHRLYNLICDDDGK